MYVVSIAGPYGKGKSYILSEAFDQPEVFPLGHHFDPETWGGGGVYKLYIFLRVLKKLVLVKYRHCISTVLTRIPKENFIADH